MADSVLTDYRGRRIVLSDATWYGHIVKGHPDLAGKRTLAERTLATSTSVFMSSSDPSCRLYYGPKQPDGLMICVVADIVNGFVKTAYFSTRIKPGAAE